MRSVYQLFNHTKLFQSQLSQFSSQQAPIKLQVRKITGQTQGSPQEVEAVLSHTTLRVEQPLQTVLAALIGCEYHTVHLLAKGLKLQIDNINFKKVEATFDPRFFKGIGPARFQTVTMEVELTTDATEEQLQKLHEETQKQCPVFNMIASSGVQMESHWKQV